MTRLFVAIEVPEQIRRDVDAGLAPLRSSANPVRWIPSDTWHVTLAFLGAVTTGDRLRAQIALQAAARAVRPCDIRLDGTLGQFGDRVLWVTVRSADHGLDALAGATRSALADAHVHIDSRPFRAHLTVARARRGTRLPRTCGPLTGRGLPARWTARRVGLWVSQRQASGARYRQAATWPLMG